MSKSAFPFTQAGINFHCLALTTSYSTGNISFFAYSLNAIALCSFIYLFLAPSLLAVCLKAGMQSADPAVVENVSLLMFTVIFF